MAVLISNVQNEPAARRSGTNASGEAKREPEAGRAALGTSLITFPPPGDTLEDRSVSNPEMKYELRSHRLRRFERRAQSSQWLIGYQRMVEGHSPNAIPGTTFGDPDWVRAPRVARCSWRIGTSVAVHSNSTNGMASFSGVERCASVWACPPCAAIIRSHRAKEIALAVKFHLDRGGGLYFLTLTLRHKSMDDLKSTLDQSLKAWQRAQSRRDFSWLKDELKMIGSVRSTEVTLGLNGWHPHHHILLFTRAPATDEIAHDVEASIFDIWLRVLEGLQARVPSRERGCIVKPVKEDGRVLANYVSKLQEHDRPRLSPVATEVARADWKSGRRGSIVPFELLDNSDQLHEKLWLEYYLATHGRRAFSWTKGLRALTLPQALIEEASDEQVIDANEKRLIRLVLSGADYDEHVKNQPAVMAVILNLIEGNDVGTASLLGCHSPDQANALKS